MQCYCGSGETFENCCAPYIEGRETAADAESLMRSRYSAYVVGAGAYLVATTVPQQRVPEDAALIGEHASQTRWLRLEVLGTEASGAESIVIFKACYRGGDDVIKVHHEKSFFDKIDGRWFYREGIRYDASVGRNDTCPCGSGRKYKKCCGARS